MYILTVWSKSQYIVQCIFLCLVNDPHGFLTACVIEHVVLLIKMGSLSDMLCHIQHVY